MRQNDHIGPQVISTYVDCIVLSIVLIYGKHITAFSYTIFVSVGTPGIPKPSHGIPELYREEDH